MSRTIESRLRALAAILAAAHVEAGAIDRALCALPVSRDVVADCDLHAAEGEMLEVAHLAFRAHLGADCAARLVAGARVVA
jgi:hypothetical protein